MQMSYRISILIQIFTFLFVISALAVPGDENWATTWGLPGTDGEVFGVLEFNGDLVIVGAFTQVGDVAAIGVALYDGSSWSPMGNGLGGIVRAVHIFDNELHIGGEFTLSGGTPGGGLAKWSGSAWETVGGGTDGEVEDMAIFNGELVVCGDFSEVGDGNFCGGIASWSGTVWNTLDGGTESGAIFNLTADSNYLYVTGYFEDIGVEYANNIARWNGSTWSAMGSGLTDELGDPYEAEGAYLHIYDGNVVVTGYFAHAGGQALSNLAVWDGGSWGTLGLNPDLFADGAHTIGDYAGQLYIYNGFSHLWNWNGIFWTAEINGGQFSAMGQYGSDMVIGGSFLEINGVPLKNLGLYDGSTFSALASGNGINGSVDVVHDWNGQLVVGGGGQTIFGTIADQMIVTWDGSQWNSLGSGLQGHISSYLVDLETYQGDLVVSGLFTTAGGVPASRFARWDGTTWSQIGDGSPNGAGDMTVINGELFALVANPDFNVSRLNPETNAWEYVGNTSPGHSLSSLGQYNGQLVVTGNFSDFEGVVAQGIIIGYGSTWVPLGAGIAGTVVGMAELDGKLYVAGGFATAGGLPAYNSAVWDGSNWNPMGSGLNNQAFHLEEINGDIFVTGEMTTAEGSPVSHLARWDGTAWQSMGSGLNNPGNDIAAVNGKLFVVGDFSSAGGIFSAGIAEWNLVDVSAVGPFNPNKLALAPGAPNPFTNGTTFFFELTEPGDVKVNIFDVRGHRVSQRFLAGLSVGSHTFSWDGRDLRGRRAANGTYFVQVRTVRQQGMQRVTILR